MRSQIRASEEMRSDFAALLHPLERSQRLPSYYYRSSDILERETREIFSKEWSCVGRVDEVPSPGDYFTLDVHGEPLVVVRDDTGEVRVLSTVCRHRGALVVEGRGRCRNFSCPFHGWTYSLQGELLSAPLMGPTGGFDRKQHSLYELKTEVWQGFLFVNFDPNARPLAPRLAGLEERFGNYNFSDLRACEPMIFTNECNWKLSVEQGIDMYHVPATHPEVAHYYRVAETFGEEDPERAWTTSFTPCEKPHPWVSGTQLEQSPFPAIDGLSEFELQSFNIFLIYPNSLIACVPDGALYLLFFPEGVDRTQVRINLCYPESTTRLPDFQRNLEDALQGFEELNYQDMAGARGTHTGMSSRFSPTGGFSPLERTTWELGKYVVRRLQAADPALRTDS